jgi:hypothetical protein
LTGTDQIFECKVEVDRVLRFFFVGKRLILTHGFRKTGDKTPKREIERAEGYKREFEMRGRTSCQKRGEEANDGSIENSPVRGSVADLKRRLRNWQSGSN